MISNLFNISDIYILNEIAGIINKNTFVKDKNKCLQIFNFIFIFKDKKSYLFKKPEDTDLPLKKHV